jgi:hypothetical protein
VNIVLGKVLTQALSFTSISVPESMTPHPANQFHGVEAAREGVFSLFPFRVPARERVACQRSTSALRRFDIFIFT